MGALQVALYITFAFFVIMVVAKMIKINRMPLHLRWDLYPIPHEKGKGEYGGSYFEELDWWTKRREFSLISELVEMAKEIILIQSLFKNNRALWYFSFPFHIGLYCLVGWVLLMFVGAIALGMGATVSVGATGFGLWLYHLTMVVGTAGLVLALVGAVGLLLSRMFRSELSQVSVPSDYFNLLIFVALSGAALWSLVQFDPGFSGLREFLSAAIRFDAAEPLSLAVGFQLWILAFIFVYMPFTHMTHFVSKYFTYHKVRWEDEPNIRGSHIEKAVQKALGFNISWEASHIKGSTWAQAATEEGSKHE